MGEVLLELDKLCKYYTGNQSVVVGLNEISLSFRRGEFVAVTGESGSGKSTLAQVLCGILPYESGEMRFCGKPTSHYAAQDWERYRRESISYISQNYGILPGGTVLSNVVSALRIQGMEPAAAGQKAEELLKMVELWELKNRRAAKLSSGQKQRLSIARALAKPAPILVADEPTGNLDRENSEKIIRLLALAARERLVILITHDFQEAEDTVTRRIILQDGKVTQNLPLRDDIPGEAPAHPRQKSRRKDLSLYIARLQISGRPVWSVLVGAFFALTAFAVFAFLGTYLVNLDDTSTRIYDDSAFLNGDRTRLVVQRADSGSFTQEDYETLLSLEHVRSLERNSYLADWQYAWQQDVDYTLHYDIKTSESIHSNEKEKVISVELQTDQCAFLQTVPVLPEGQTFLTAGRLPENLYEVVLAGSAERIGETINVYFRDRDTMSVAAYIPMEVTVVGVTDVGSGLYFSDILSRMVMFSRDNDGILPAPAKDICYDSYLNGDIGMTLPRQENEVILSEFGGMVTVDTVWVTREGEETPVELKVIGNTTLFRGMVMYSPDDGELPGYTVDRAAMEAAGYELDDAGYAILQDMVGHVRYRVRPTGEGSDYMLDSFLSDDQSMLLSEIWYNQYASRMNTVMAARLSGETFYIVDSVNVPYADYCVITPAAFERTVPDDNPNQVSLFLTDYAYTDEAMADIQTLGYLVISPFRVGSTQKNTILAAERQKTLQICLLALVAVAVLQLLVLRELFGVENESYRLLADMGLGGTQAGRSLWWQVLCFAVLGQMLAFGAIRLCGVWGIRRIQTILRYLPAGNWLLLALVHLSVSLLAAAMIVAAMKKRVYPQAKDAGDLNLAPLDEEEMAL